MRVRGFDIGEHLKVLLNSVVRYLTGLIDVSL